MPPLFAHVLAAALHDEFSKGAVEVELEDCSAQHWGDVMKRLGKRGLRASTADKFQYLPVSARKHFTVLGGGSLLEYFNHNKFWEIGRSLMPLYLFGAGFQVSKVLERAHLAATLGCPAAAVAATPGGCHGERLLWGGVRGPLSRDIFNLAAGSGAVEIIGDPGFFADILLQTADLTAPTLLPPGKFVLTTCDLTSAPSLVRGLDKLLRSRPNVNLVVLSIGAMRKRRADMDHASRALVKQFGVRRTTVLELAKLSDLPRLFAILRGAAVGINCMLHAGILQAAVGGAAVANFDSFKHLDAWLTFDTSNLVHGLRDGGARATADLAWRAAEIMSSTAVLAPRLLLHREDILARHITAMRTFLRYLVLQHPLVGAVLSCAPVKRTHKLVVRSQLLTEGGTVEVLWRPISKA